MKQIRYRNLPASEVDIVVREDIDIELELKLLAACDSYVWGTKSMDRLLKRHGEAWRKQLEISRKIQSTD